MNLPLEHPDNLFYQDMSMLNEIAWYQSSSITPQLYKNVENVAPPIHIDTKPKEKDKSARTKKESKKWSADETFELLKSMEKEGGKLSIAKSNVNRVKFEDYLVAKFHLSSKQQIFNKLDALYKQYLKKKEEFKVGKSGYNQKVDWPYFEACQKVWEVKVEVMKKFIKQGKDLPLPTSNGLTQMAQVLAISDEKIDYTVSEGNSDTLAEQRVIKKKKQNNGAVKATLNETIQKEMTDTGITLKNLLGSTNELMDLVKAVFLKQSARSE